MTEKEIERPGLVAVYDEEDLCGEVYAVPSTEEYIRAEEVDILEAVKKYGRKVCEFDSVLVDRTPRAVK